jgi:tetratricopeptide (TPR) repeat protein
LRWVRALSSLVEHDGAVQRRLSELLLESGEVEPARVAAHSAVYAEMENPASYATLALALERSGQLTGAESAWQSAVACPAPAAAIARTHEQFAQFYERRGKGAQAKSELEKARAVASGLERQH